MSEKSTKIFLWTVPRSCSTAFSMAITKLENSKIVIEPFGYAYYYGEERISPRFKDAAPQPDLTFREITDSFENKYNEYSVVFVKEMAVHTKQHAELMDELLERGYKHTFLIRNPRKTVTSMYRISTQGETTGWNYFDKVEAEFQSLHDLFFKIKDKTGETSIVVEADDLLANPGGVMKTYCGKVGLSFSEDMLTWEKGGMKTEEADFPGWQSTLIQSTGFNKPSHNPADSIALSEEANQAIEENMEYYNVLSKYKLNI